MKAHTANLVNAATLIIMGLWGYFGSPEDTRSMTALIPAIGGAVLLGLQQGVKTENKVLAHIAVLLTLLLIIAIATKPFPAAMERGDTMAIVRMSAMLLTGFLAMIAFIRSFRAARMAREAGE